MNSLEFHFNPLVPATNHVSKKIPWLEILVGIIIGIILFLVIYEPTEPNTEIDFDPNQTD